MPLNITPAERGRGGRVDLFGGDQFEPTASWLFLQHRRTWLSTPNKGIAEAIRRGVLASACRIAATEDHESAITWLRIAEENSRAVRVALDEAGAAR